MGNRESRKQRKLQKSVEIKGPRQEQEESKRPSGVKVDNSQLKFIELY